MLLRDATQADLPAILAIYNDVIANSNAIYTETPVTLEDRTAWLALRATQGYPVLVADDDGQVAGVASFGDFRPYPGFRTTVEHSVHIHRDWRGKDRPTDVLAFAQREAAAADAGLLGDIVISVDTARRQAKRGLYAELVHLASHGLCHLLGYDHRDDEEERVMNARAAGLRREGRRTGRVRAA